MECYCYLRNIQDRLSDWKTPYERRFGEPLKGPIVPFGSLVEYHPTSTKDQSRIHQFGKESTPWNLPWLCLKRGGIWKGDIMVGDLALRSWKRWTHRKSMLKDSMQKK